MKKNILIGLGIIYTLIAVAAAGVVIHFWPYISAVDMKVINFSNIKALYVGLTEEPDVTNERKKELDDERSDEIRNYIDMELRDFTDEEKREIEEGSKSKTEILAQIITETIENNDNMQNNTQDKPNTAINNSDKPADSNKETAEQVVARHIAAMYTIQREFEGRVSALSASAHNWIHAYKAANPNATWKDAKVAGVKYFSGTASQIENDCYAKVDNEIELLKSDLKAIGADTSIVSTIKATVYSEMDARKAQIVQMGRAKLNKNE